MIRILDRLVARSFTKVFIAFILGAPILFILGDITENLEDYLDQDLTGMAITKAYLFMLPQFIQWAFPIAALVAVVFTIQTMTLHREIVAAKAGGISFHRLIVPIITLGVVLTGVALGLGAVVPRANTIAAEILQQEDFRRDFRGNFSFQGEDGRNFSVRSLSVSGGTLNEVVMETVEPGSNRPLDHLIARIVRFDPEVGWTFEDGYYRIFPESGEELAFKFETLQTRGFQERPEDFLEEPKDPEEMTYQEMGRLADIMTRSGGRPQKLLVDRQEKLAIPVATLIIILFGAPLATSTKRGGTAYGIGIALLSTILYMLLFRISGAFGETGALEPFLGGLATQLHLPGGRAFLLDPGQDVGGLRTPGRRGPPRELLRATWIAQGNPSNISLFSIPVKRGCTGPSRRTSISGETETVKLPPSIPTRILPGRRWAVPYTGGRHGAGAGPGGGRPPHSPLPDQDLDLVGLREPGPVAHWSRMEKHGSRSGKGPTPEAVLLGAPRGSPRSGDSRWRRSVPRRGGPIRPFQGAAGTEGPRIASDGIDPEPGPAHLHGDVEVSFRLLPEDLHLHPVPSHLHREAGAGADSASREEVGPEDPKAVSTPLELGSIRVEHPQTKGGGE